MELWTDSQDKENLDPASLRLHGAGGNKGGSGLGGGANGAGGGGSKGSRGSSSDASASGSATKKRKLAAAGSAAMDTDAGLAGLGGNGKAQHGQQRKRALLRSCSTPPPASSAAAALPAKQQHQHQHQMEQGGNDDENADPQQHHQQQHHQEQHEARRAETHNSKLFGILGNRSQPAANSDRKATGNLLGRLASLADIRLPTGSPSKKAHQDEARGLHDGDAGDEEDDSPFNEGYGTRRTLPRDLSLKSGLCFEAARPFDWCRAVPAALEARGMLQHLREAAGVVAGHDEDVEAEGIATGLRTRDEALAAWVAASYYYAFPADRLPAPQHLALQQVRRQVDAGVFAPKDPPPVAAGAWQPQGGESGGGEAAAPAVTGQLYRRLREWEEAFRHLYGLYRHDAGTAFYLVAPDFTVAWTRKATRAGEAGKMDDGDDDSSLGKAVAEVGALLSGDEEEEDEGKASAVPGTEEEDEEEGPYKLKAVISTSKRWLRERLRAAGVPFRLPLAPDAAARDQEDGPAPDVRAELEALRRHDLGVGGHATVELQVAGVRRRRGPGGGEIPRQRSHLVVEGALGVHGLFTFLSDLGNSLAPSAVADVPRLLALKPFAHGSLGRLQVAANTPVQRTLMLGGEGGMETVYQLKLRGPVLPAQLRRLAGVVHFFNREGLVGDEPTAQPPQRAKGAMAEGDWSLTMEVAPGTEAFNNHDGGKGEGGGEGDGGMMSMKEVRYHAGRGRFVTIRMTAPAPAAVGGRGR